MWPIEKTTTYVWVSSVELQKLLVARLLLLQKFFKLFRGVRGKLVQRLLSALKECLWKTILLVLTVIVRNGRKEGGVRVMGFGMDFFDDRSGSVSRCSRRVRGTLEDLGNNVLG